MKEQTELRLMFWFTVAYLAFFTVLAIVNRNFEFLYYTFIMSAIIFIIVFYHKKIHLSMHLFFGLTILGVLHIFGGNIHIGGIRLYELWLLPNIFRYDNLVHSFGTFVATFAVYSLLRPHLDVKIKHNYFLLALLLISITMGFGAFNEILELGAVLFLGAAEQVGDYFNNAFDLVFNLLGSIVACVIILEHHAKQKQH